MKKLFTTICIFATLQCIAFAQEKARYDFEIGAGFGIMSSFPTESNTESCYGPGLYFEYGEFLSNNLRLGEQLSYKYGVGKGFVDEAEGTTYDLTSNQIGLKTTGEVYFCTDRLINPFVGLELGLGYYWINRSDSSKANFLFPTFGLRAGAQVWRFRLLMDFDILSCKKDMFNNTYKGIATVASFNLGFSF